MENFLNEFPEKVRENFKQNGGEYLTLHNLLNEMSGELELHFLPYLCTKNMDKLYGIMLNEIPRMTNRYMVDDCLAHYAIDGAYTRLSLMNHILQKSNFEKWYDSKAGIKANRAARRKNKVKRDQYFLVKPMELSQNTTESEFTEKVIEDMRKRGMSFKEIKKWISNGQVRGYLDGKLVDIKKVSSYN